MSLNIGAVMNGLGVRLATISGLRVYDFPADDVAVPAGVVGYPDPLEWDVTMDRDTDRATIPVHIVVSKVSDRASRDALTAYMAGSGAGTVKDAIEAEPTLGGAAASVRVMDVRGVNIRIAGVDYVAATFNVDVVG